MTCSARSQFILQAPKLSLQLSTRAGLEVAEQLAKFAGEKVDAESRIKSAKSCYPPRDVAIHLGASMPMLSRQIPASSRPYMCKKMDASENARVKPLGQVGDALTQQIGTPSDVQAGIVSTLRAGSAFTP